MMLPNLVQILPAGVWEKGDVGQEKTQDWEAPWAQRWKEQSWKVFLNGSPELATRGWCSPRVQRSLRLPEWVQAQMSLWRAMKQSFLFSWKCRCCVFGLLSWLPTRRNKWQRWPICLRGSVACWVGTGVVGTGGCWAAFWGAKAPLCCEYWPWHRLCCSKWIVSPPWQRGW